MILLNASYHYSNITSKKTLQESRGYPNPYREFMYDLLLYCDIILFGLSCVQQFESRLGCNRLKIIAGDEHGPYLCSRSSNKLFDKFLTINNTLLLTDIYQ